MHETPPRPPSRPTPPFSRPEGVPAQPTPIATRAVLFVPGERGESGGESSVRGEEVREALSGLATALEREPLVGPDAEPVPEGVVAPRQAASAPAVEDEFGFPDLPEVHDEPDAAASAQSDAPASGDPSMVEPVSLGVAPAGDLYLPLAEEDEERDSGPGEKVARLLESLAARIRTGEIAPPADVGGGSEEAALATVLAMLLSRRARRVTDDDAAAEGEGP